MMIQNVIKQVFFFGIVLLSSSSALFGQDTSQGTAEPDGIPQVLQRQLSSDYLALLQADQNSPAGFSFVAKSGQAVEIYSYTATTITIRSLSYENTLIGYTPSGDRIYDKVISYDFHALDDLPILRFFERSTITRIHQDRGRRIWEIKRVLEASDSSGSRVRFSENGSSVEIDCPEPYDCSMSLLSPETEDEFDSSPGSAELFYFSLVDIRADNPELARRLAHTTLGPLSFAQLTTHHLDVDLQISMWAHDQNASLPLDIKSRAQVVGGKTQIGISIAPVKDAHEQLGVDELTVQIISFESETQLIKVSYTLVAQKDCQSLGATCFAPVSFDKDIFLSDSPLRELEMTLSEAVESFLLSLNSK